ncbi:MAG: type II toxin-antitoxin system ParD family antitoxin [Microvirga sp.]
MGFNVVLSEELTQFIEGKVGAGEYGSPDELFEHAVRILKLGDRDEPIGRNGEEKLAWLRRARDKGIASGNIGPLDAEELKREGAPSTSGKGLRLGPGLIHGRGARRSARDRGLSNGVPGSPTAS